MKIGGIIQARMGSTRLPKKVLMKINGKPILEHIINRVKLSSINEIVVATTNEKEDFEILQFCKTINIPCFRGSTDNVLERFYNCARLFEFDLIVRITADDPFKDPQVIDQALDLLKESEYDYVSNTIIPTFPEGIDIEVFTFNALQKAFFEANSLSEKEHVTPYIWKNKNKFNSFNFTNPIDYSSFRWTLDTKEDLDFSVEIYKRLYKEGEVFFMKDILDVIEKEPSLANINVGFKRNEGYLKSIENEKDF